MNSFRFRLDSKLAQKITYWRMQTVSQIDVAKKKGIYRLQFNDIRKKDLHRMKKMF